ncbi:MFS transporter [Propionivibrio dicarboxylicus]|uniref:Sugar phosphate permease n=1 Tax=Propionivibrio dicarboxylicus TaxID=83767 RepID=A0A1G8GX35_9RHOO|nr:MFS transporter [Propionivibrio dicarboxylicus]SDH98958.1 Sugar phosphate permease [Propionivibrio dicarboxylicus]
MNGNELAIGSTAKARTSWYRWIVMLLIFVVYTIAYADRSNLGVALPFIKKEFALSNTEAGALVSLLFFGYAVAQIPAGLIYKKFKVRSVFPLAMIMTSIFTGLQGLTSSVFMLKLYRVGLGISEGPLPIGCLQTINHWFPPKEKGTATGIYLAASKFGAVIAPPIGVFIISMWGWREVFFAFAIPGIILSVVWYLSVKNTPEESAMVSPAELEYIRAEQAVAVAADRPAKPKRDLAWLDRLIRAKQVKLVDTSAGIWRSWNIIGNALGYFFMVGIVNVIMSWIPTYLVSEKGFATMKMGFVSAAPFVGAVAGNFIGGLISDRLLDKRRKPLMLLTALCTSVMMYSLVYAPNDAITLSALLFMAGFLLSIGYSAFSVYAMGATTKEVYPVAYGLVNTGGQLGGAVAPLVVGMILDAFNWNVVFMALAASSILTLLIIATIDEPMNEIQAGK